jgi:hypothetical protein
MHASFSAAEADLRLLRRRREAAGWRQARQLRRAGVASAVGNGSSSRRRSRNGVGSRRGVLHLVPSG